MGPQSPTYAILSVNAPGVKYAIIPGKCPIVPFSILLLPFPSLCHPACQGVAEKRVMKYAGWEKRKRRFKTDQEDCQKEKKCKITSIRNEAGITIIFIKKEAALSALRKCRLLHLFYWLMIRFRADFLSFCKAFPSICRILSLVTSK